MSLAGRLAARTSAVRSSATAWTRSATARSRPGRAQEPGADGNPGAPELAGNDDDDRVGAVRVDDDGNRGAPELAAAAGASPDPPAAPPARRERELVDEPPRPGAPPVARAVVPRWVQLAVLPIALLATWGLIDLAGKVVLIFIIAALIALVLNPAVAFLHRTRLPRGLSVLAVYLAFFLALAGIGVLVANPISNQVRAFSRNAPQLVKDANKKLGDTQAYLNRHGIHVRFIKQGKTALQTLQDKVVKGAGSIVSFGGGLLTKVVSAGFDIVLIFVVSVYMLLYGPYIGTLVRRLLPPGDGTPADDFPTLTQRAVSRYVGGQLLFSLIMGTTAGFALFLFGVLGIFPDGRTYAVAFGAFLGIMELVPYLGPILGAIPPILVALFTDPITAVWVALLFLVLQQLEGHVVSPQIFGRTLRINPLLVIFALLLGQEVEGILGALIALPLLSVLREIVVYLSRHLTLEPWDRTPKPLL
jgi:predicted PurR-regulated permease PerM